MSRSPRASLGMDATIVDYLRWRAEHQPDRRSHTHLVDGESKEVHMTFGALERRARAIAAHLTELGAHGQPVLLMYMTGLEYVAAFYGCLLAGAIAVPAYPPDPSRPDQSLPRLLSIIADCRPRLGLTSRRLLMGLTMLLLRVRAARPLSKLPMSAQILGEAVQERARIDLGAVEAIRWINSETIPDSMAPLHRAPAIGGEDVAYLQYTSGSTGAPRGVVVRHRNVVANLWIGTDLIDVTEESSAVGWVPLYHDLGLVCYVTGSAFNGCLTVLLSPLDFLEKPLRWLRAISRYRATHNAGPNFSYDLCVRRTSEEERATLDLSSWRVAGNGAEPVRAETIRRFTEAFAPCGFRAGAFFPSYGLAEATLFVSAGKSHDAAPRVVDEKLVSCGRPGEGHEVAIVDPATLRRLAAGEVGEIWYRGPSVAGGYFQRPEESAETFEARTADGEGPYLRTGDLGFEKDGEIFLSGRIKDLIIQGGKNHHPLDIEQAVWEASPRFRPGCGAAFSVTRREPGGGEGDERVVVVQEVREAAPEQYAELARALRHAVTEATGATVHEVVFIRQRTIPKTSSGKIQRRGCRELYLSRRLDELYRS
jgi:acyl-CoA synthetase (AMP-forming)/AMP-acid ligase II